MWAGFRLVLNEGVGWKVRPLMRSWVMAARSPAERDLDGRLLPASSSRQYSRTSAGPTPASAPAAQMCRRCTAVARCHPHRPRRPQSAAAVPRAPFRCAHGCWHWVRPAGRRPACRSSRHDGVIVHLWYFDVDVCAVEQGAGACPEPVEGLRSVLSEAKGCACGNG